MHFYCIWVLILSVYKLLKNYIWRHKKIAQEYAQDSVIFSTPSATLADLSSWFRESWLFCFVSDETLEFVH